MEINKIYNENCLDTMARMPDGFIDLAVTSPPYDGLRTYNGYSFPFQDIARELFRITKDGGVVVWIVGDATVKGSESGTSFRQALYFKEVGFNLHDTMIYKKPNLPKNHNRYEQDFEYMFILSKGKPNTFIPIRIPNKQFGRGSTGATFRHEGKETKKIHSDKPIKKDRIKGNCWNIDCGYMRSSKDKISFKHPATFPEQLANDHIVSWTNENDLVYDPFMGSGTTAKMAVLNNRNYVGSEISKEYCEIAEKRINENL